MPTARRNRHTRPQRGQLHPPERLEDRLAMDGAGFVNTDPPEDPESIVGVAAIVANDDYVLVSRGTQSIRISPLINDRLPEGATKLTIKLVSDTAVGAKVTISEDGKHLIYTAAGDKGFESWDSFYYIVQTEDGQLGKANVQLGRKSEPRNPLIPPTPVRRIYPSYTILEDSAERLLNIVPQYLRYPEYEGAEIVSVTMPEGGGAIRIADDGQGLWYQPQYAFRGRDSVMITVRAGDGTEYDFKVHISVIKPYRIDGMGDGRFVERGTGPAGFSPLGNDDRLREFEVQPYMESANVPDYAGTVAITANGQGLIYTPEPDFEGRVQISYKVRYGEADYQFVTGGLYASVGDGYQAVENYFLVDPNSPTVMLDVLANDANYRAYYGLTLRIVDVSAASAGGTVTHNGRVLSYRPAAGYEGDETFTYTVESSSGVRQTAQVTIEVAPRAADPFGVPQFSTQRELEQYLIDRAVQYHGGAFGQFEERYPPLPEGVVLRNYFVTDSMNYASVVGLNGDYSETNTQVDGVDEADIVETDGRYVYTLSRGKLAIVDLVDPANPVLVSLTEFETRIDEMYLQGDRLTLIHKGAAAKTYRSGIDSGYYQQLEADQAVVTVLDISDRAAPALLERTEIDGVIVDSRAIGSKVHIVAQREFEFPELGGRWIVEPELSELDDLPIDPLTGLPFVTSFSQLGTQGVWANHTLEEYLASVRQQLIEVGLPSFTTYDSNGDVVASGLLTTPTDLHKPLSGEAHVISLLTIDVGDTTPGPAAEATSFIADSQTTVYMSTESAYLFAYNGKNDETTISKLDLQSDGTQPLVATGTIRGKLLNQFSADEHDGRLRVATTQQERQSLNNGRTWRQLRLFNNLQVIEQHGSQLKVVGEVVNLAPTETIKSVRFLGDRAYVVTFRVVDPLFSIDLSNPTTPVVRGAIKIPGFSDYLHPVGSDYLLAIGRDADEITGRLGPFQITLFDVSNLDDPKVADQVTFEGALSVRSEAWIDHHAVAFFDESGVLAVPLAWSEEVTKQRDDGTTNETFEQHEATWTFKVKTNGNAKLTATGSIEHPKRTSSGFVALSAITAPSLIVTTNVWIPPLRFTPQPMQRALRIGNTLITVSQDWLQAHKLNNPSKQLGEVHFGPPVADDRFTIEEDSGPHTFEVLTNDPPTATGEPTTIFALSDVSGGTAQVSEDGLSVVFTPDVDFFGFASFVYTVDAPFLGEVSARVTVNVQGTPDAPMAVDDTFVVDASAQTVELDVLANDLNPDFRSFVYLPYFIDSLAIDSIQLKTAPTNEGLVIANIGPTSSGAAVEVNDQGLVVYTPAEGFAGIDTFDYTIRDRLGRIATATATIYVGVEPPAEPPESGETPTAEHAAPGAAGSEPTSLLFAGIASLFDRDRESLFEMFERESFTGAMPRPANTVSDLAQVEPALLWTSSVDRAFDEQFDWRLERYQVKLRDSSGMVNSVTTPNTAELNTSLTTSVRNELGLHLRHFRVSSNS